MIQETCPCIVSFENIFNKSQKFNNFFKVANFIRFHENKYMVLHHISDITLNVLRLNLLNCDNLNMEIAKNDFAMTFNP